ncbi:S24 family peptidase [Ruminococcus sp. AM43-6]|uniref:S24 family peptidase n=1 Tax=Ruminococcus sp. AM43-6 TaxID=2293216 RepID=UPI001FA90244|nr:S24 family peptidase [Ruminococcus sp. AM43-6]UYJ32181.1 MAG: S24 family peptidase [Oscillospiraceae bacterium]
MGILYQIILTNYLNKKTERSIFLISLNEKYAPIKVSENDRLDIFGKVLGKFDASAITGHYR